MTHPKSMATVVVIFSGVWERSSMPAATEVMDASVVSGSISEMAPTVVVLPTPKPPAMTILTGIGGRDASLSALTDRAPGVGDSSETIDNPSQYGGVAGGFGLRCVQGQLTVGAQIVGEHPDHIQMHPQLRRDLRQ